MTIDERIESRAQALYAAHVEGHALGASTALADVDEEGFALERYGQLLGGAV